MRDILTVEDIVALMRSKSYIIDMGAKKVSKWLKVSEEAVKEARKVIRREKLLTEVPEHKKLAHVAPRILILDIETAPNRAYVWRFWRQNVYLDQIISNWFMIGWSAKWLLEEGVFSQVLEPAEILKENDYRIVETLWHLLNQADIVVAHNGESFDIPKIKSRFLIHGLPPTTFYQQVDTKKVAAKEFGFESNKLEALARLFGIEGKIETDFTLWSRCMDGNAEALIEMEAYNRQDIVVLEEVYLRLRPYIKSHPNWNLFTDSLNPVCPICGCEHLEPSGYYYFTQTGKYPNFRCMGCGALSRDRHSVYKSSKTILVSNGK